MCRFLPTPHVCFCTTGRRRRRPDRISGEDTLGEIKHLVENGSWAPWRCARREPLGHGHALGSAIRAQGCTALTIQRETGAVETDDDGAAHHHPSHPSASPALVLRPRIVALTPGREPASHKLPIPRAAKPNEPVNQCSRSLTLVNMQQQQATEQSGRDTVANCESPPRNDSLPAPRSPVGPGGGSPQARPVIAPDAWGSEQPAPTYLIWLAYSSRAPSLCRRKSKHDRWNLHGACMRQPDARARFGLRFTNGHDSNQAGLAYLSTIHGRGVDLPCSLGGA